MAFSVSFNSPLFKVLAIGAIAPTVWLLPRALKHPGINLLSSGAAVLSLLTLRKELKTLILQESRQRRLLLASEDIFDLELAREIAIAENYPELPQAHHQKELPPAGELPPIRDLGLEIANLKRHVIFVASTTSGKTTLMTQVIANSAKLPHQLIVIDGKGDRRLVQGVSKYYQANTSERAVQVIAVLENLAAELGARQDLAMQGQDKFPPITLIIDELNLIRIFLGQSSKEDLTMFTRLLTHLLLQGASAKIFLRVSAHTSRVNALGLDGGVLDSLSFIALGRGGSFESLEDLLEYQVKGRKSRKFQDELDVLFSADFDETLIFSTLKPMGFFRLPLVTPAVVVGSNPQTQNNQDVQDVRSQLNRIYQQSPAPDTKLEFPLGEIVELSKKQGTIKARDCQNNVTGLKKVSPDEIRSYFRLLNELEYGYCEGEASQLSFCAYS